MYYSIKILIINVFVFFFLAGCNKHDVINDNQEILFQYNYINYAWGYQHNGYFIDNEGNILAYNNPEEWNFPDNNYNLSKEQFIENVHHCHKTGEKIEYNELIKYTGYIKNIASCKVTARKNIAVDAGSSEYICYQLSGNNELYKGYIIKIEGNSTCENLNFYSKKLASWMKDINNRINKN